MRASSSGPGQQFLELLTRVQIPLLKAYTLLLLVTEGVVAQLVRAADCRSAGCGFKSHLPRTPMTTFQPSENFRDKVTKVFPHFKAIILELLPNAEVEHMGGTAVPGALTKGDIDIQIRIRQEDFSQYLEILKHRFVENNRHLWTSDFAIFKDETEFPEEDKVDMLVTMIDSPSDVCHKYRDLLRTNSELREEYNRMKLASDGRSKEEYAEAKELIYQKLRKAL